MTDFSFGGTVGSPSGLMSDGTERELALDKLGGLIGSDARGRFWEQVSRGNVYSAAAQAAVTFAAGLSTTAVFTLYNPRGSGVRATVLHAGFCFSAAPAAAATVYLTGNLDETQAVPAGVTPITPRCNLLGGGTPACLVYSACTLAAAPTVLEPLISVLAVGSITPPLVDRFFDGRFVLREGISVTIEASAAASGFPSVTWLETPSPAAS